MPNQAFAMTEGAGHMTELLIVLGVVILVFGLFWWAITLIPLPSPGGLLAHIALSIAMVVALLGYVLPMVHMPPRATRKAATVVTGKPTPRTP
jgi:hypothetical protein